MTAICDFRSAALRRESRESRAVSPAIESWDRACVEPSLAEVYADPIVHLVMRRDGVTIGELRAVVADARAKSRSRLCCQAAA